LKTAADAALHPFTAGTFCIEQCIQGHELTDRFVCLFVCLLQDASGHSNVLKAGKAEELKDARKRRTARKAN